LAGRPQQLRSISKHRQQVPLLLPLLLVLPLLVLPQLLLLSLQLLLWRLRACMEQGGSLHVTKQLQPTATVPATAAADPASAVAAAIAAAAVAAGVSSARACHLPRQPEPVVQVPWRQPNGITALLLLRRLVCMLGLRL
jgi:hypothetical protein